MKKPNISTKFIYALIILTLYLYICTGNVYALERKDTLRKPIGNDALLRQKETQLLIDIAGTMSSRLLELAKVGKIDIALFSDGKGIAIMQSTGKGSASEIALFEPSPNLDRVVYLFKKRSPEVEKLVIMITDNAKAGLTMTPGGFPHQVILTINGNDDPKDITKKILQTAGLEKQPVRGEQGPALASKADIFTRKYFTDNFSLPDIYRLVLKEGAKGSPHSFVVTVNLVSLLGRSTCDYSVSIDKSKGKISVERSEGKDKDIRIFL